jgi:hypothetical protein
MADLIPEPQRPEQGEMVMDWSLLVALYVAEAWAMESALIRGTPRCAGGMATSWMFPRSLLS